MGTRRLMSWALEAHAMIYGEESAARARQEMGARRETPTRSAQHPKQMPAQLEADTVFTPGTRVTTDRGLPGTVKWAGRIQGAKGEWVGIELDSKKGKNSGEAKGVK